MEIFLSIALAVVFFAFLGAVFYWRKSEKETAARENEITQLRAQFESESGARAEAEKERGELRGKSETAKVESGKAAARAESAEKSAAKLGEENTMLRAQTEQNAARIAELETNLQNAEKTAAEKILLLKEVRESMGAEFKNLSQNILEEKGKKFGEESGNLLNPLREELEKFRNRADEIRTEDAKDRSALKQQIESLQSNAAEYGKSADNLARALKGDSKTQGGWGEIMLANLLEKSGLREGEEYETQKSVRGEDGNILRPDVVVNLPDGKHLIIDSKVSLRAFCDAAESESPDEEKAALVRHADAVKTHVAGLSGKHYARAKGVNAPDFVFMFMEIEPAFFAALKESPNLFSDAYDKKIILCAPTTLMATLRTVERIWKLERQNRNAEEIAKRGGALFDKFSGFIDNMDAIDTALVNARKSYDSARGQLETGHGNLIGQANKLYDLGANTKKNRLPEPENILLEETAPADGE